jgi:hypothetical protein
MSKIPFFPKETINHIEKILAEFDDKFRTAEAHNTGKLRKLSLMMEPFYENEQILFIYFANVLNHTIINIGEMIEVMKS